MIVDNRLAAGFMTVNHSRMEKAPQGFSLSDRFYGERQRFDEHKRQRTSIGVYLYRC